MGRKRSEPKQPPPKFATYETSQRNYVPMFRDQLDSPAYIALTAAAKEAYTILRYEYKYKYTNERIGMDRVYCPYSTFEARGMRSGTLTRALFMLEAFGFIHIEEHGGLEHRPNLYHLIDDWKKIKTKEEAKAVKANFEQAWKDRAALLKKAKEKAVLYGKYISSDETVPYLEQIIGEIADETVPKQATEEKLQHTKPSAEQPTKPSVKNEQPKYSTWVAEIDDLYGNRIMKRPAMRVN